MITLKKHECKLKKLVVIISLSFISLIIIFCLSTFKYQQLVNEGSIIADKQCLNVNPLIIQRKNSYTETIRIAKLNGSEKDYWKEQERYLTISKKYRQHHLMLLHSFRKSF